MADAFPFPKARTYPVVVSQENLTKKNLIFVLKVVDIIKKYGYPVEQHHNILTEDGYLLDMQRIPYGINEHNNNTKKPAILLMHGLVASAEHYVVLGPQRSLAFILADKGFDVWLGNARGTNQSRKHIYLNPNTSHQYWNFR